MILIILMTSQFLFPQPITQSNFSNQVDSDYLIFNDTFQAIETHKTFDSNELFQIRREVVVFAPDETSYNLLKDLSYSKSYDTLLAIKIGLNQIEQKTLSEFYNFIYPFSVYTKATMPSYIESKSNIQLDGETESDLLGVSKLWNLGYNGQNVVVGVIDNGVDFSHPDLSASEFTSKNFTIPGATINYGHGTSVAGTIVSSGVLSFDGKAKGTAFGSKIASANMGQSAEGYLVGDFLEAFDWLANITEVKVINTSWSGGGEDIWIPVAQRLEQLGIMIVGAAGNEGSGIFNVLGSPANSVHGLSVASQSIGGSVSSFSSQGPVGGGFTKPDVSSFGERIQTTNTNGGYRSMSGTSFSAPLVSGTVATIISALENDSIPYNVGLLKSAIMSTAKKNNGISEDRVGQGLVNASAAYNLILNRTGNNTNNVTSLSFATPTEGFFHQLTNLRRNTQSEIPFTLISSTPELISLNLEGNISNIMGFPNVNQTFYSQLIFITTNTSNANLGVYNGNITITDSTETIKIPIQVTVKETPDYRVLFDLKHTATDVGYTVYRAGYKTGTLIELINQDGGWVDLVNEAFTTNLLKNYDLVWLPDPFGLIGEESTDITSDEIEVLQDYISGGGNLFVHYFGKFIDSLAISNEYSIVGTNVNPLNVLLHPYGIQASDETPDIIKYFTSEDNPSTQTIYNTSTLGKDVSTITSYKSTPIITSDNAVQVSSNSHIASWSKAGNGRVLVSSTDSWFSSSNAINNPSSDDYQFMKNAIDWLTAYPRIDFENLRKTGNIVELDISVSNQTNYFGITPEIKFLHESNPATFSMTNSDLGQYHISISFVEDGFFSTEISISTDYQVLPILIDTTGPIIGLFENISETYNHHEEIIHSFFVEDILSEINQDSIKVLVNTEIYNQFNFTSNNLTLEFSSEFFKEGSHNVIIQASDTLDNLGEFSYSFRIINSNNSDTSQYIVYSILIGISLIILIPIMRNYIRNKSNS